MLPGLGEKPAEVFKKSPGLGLGKLCVCAEHLARLMGSSALWSEKTKCKLGLS